MEKQVFTSHVHSKTTPLFTLRIFLSTVEITTQMYYQGLGFVQIYINVSSTKYNCLKIW